MVETGGPSSEVAALLSRSHRLGADRRNTNYAGGNTSCKARAADPVTGDPVELLWVKGSGGDLGTLDESGLAVLRLDRLRALVDVYPGAEREDEMVTAFDYCRHGAGGAAPSIDTAMHGLVEAAHVDHLHPESGLALATAADGEALTKECFGERVAWVPWRRPGFQLGMDVAALTRARPDAIGVILGGHGITAWGATSDECEARSLEIVRTAERFIEDRGTPDPLGPVVPGFEPLPEAERRHRAAALAPVIRGLCSRDRRQVGHFSDEDVVLDFLSRAEHPRLAALGTSCPDHFIRTKVRPLVLDLAPSAPLEATVRRLGELHAVYRDDYRAYYERNAGPDSPPMRGADPAIVLMPGVGMFSFGASEQAARIAGEFFESAIAAMRGAEALSTYAPIPESEKFGIEYWALEEAKLRRLPPPKPLAGRVAYVAAGDPDIGAAVTGRLAAEGASVAAASRGEEDPVAEPFREAILTRGGVDVVVVVGAPAERLVDSAAAVMAEQGMGGDIVFVADADDRVRELAAELAPHGIRVNGVDPAREARPEDVAAAVFALASGDLSRTTGTVIPVGAATARG